MTQLPTKNVELASYLNAIKGKKSKEICIHHWVIQPANGPVSNGACQICGENREFENYVESAHSSIYLGKN